MKVGMIRLALAAGGILVASWSGLPIAWGAETCTTQSQMQPADRDALASAATSLATKIQADDEAGLKAITISEFQGNFAGIASTISETAPKVRGAETQVDQVYLLDATSLKAGANGANPDAQFFCTLNKSTATTEFSIPQLPPGKYGFAILRMEEANPWRISVLMRQDGGKWLLAGLYPKPLTADGHDGLWYWKEARTLSTQKQPWAAWLYYREAENLVTPANFVSSTHLEKLQAETQTAAPPAVANGVSPEAPMVLKSTGGEEFRFVSLGVEDAVGLDVAAHMKVEAVDDPAAARKRNVAAATALLAAHPELRSKFHGIWVFAEAPGKSPYATELAMSEIQ